jgi:hypothetical protein
MTRIPHIALATATAAAVILAAGCGGAGSGPATLSHAQLVTQADHICATYNREVSDDFAGATSDAELARSYGTYLRQFDHQLGLLRALRPAAADAKAYSAWLAAGTALRPLLVATRPPASDDSVGRVVMAGARVSAMADAMGMQDCAIDVDRNEQGMTKQRYIQLADGICQGGSDAFGLLPTPADLPGVVTQIDRLKPVLASVQRDLHAIPKPQGDEAAIGAWLAARDQADAEIEQMRTVAAAGDMAAYGKIGTKLAHDSAYANGRAAAYGIRDCS